MGAARRFLARLWNSCFPSRSEIDLDREISSHLALIASDLERKGIPTDTAHLTARRMFGGVEQAKERYRDARSFPWLDDLRRDLRYAIRTFGREPGLVSIIVLTLAIGIGANTAIFSVVHGVLLRPLPYPGSSQIMRVWENVPAAEMFNGRAQRYGAMDVSDLLAIAPRTRAVSHLVAYGSVRPTASFDGIVTRLQGASVSPNMFDMIGVAPSIGRGFSSTDDGAPGVVVLSNETWRRFGSRPDIVGRAVTFSGDPTNPMLRGVSLGISYTIIGVMPPGFQFPYDRTDFWVPRTLSPPANGRPLRLETVARLAPGHTPAQAAAELASLRPIPAAPGQPSVSALPRYDLIPVRDEIVGPVSAALLALTAAVAVVLLIACVNVAHLLLVRAVSREREFIMRSALGAGRTRLIRQLLTESLLLAVAGGIAGAGVAIAGVRLFKELASGLGRSDLGVATVFPRLADVAVDRTVFAYALGISAATSVLFGLAPALHASRPGGTCAARRSSTSSRRRLTNGLLVAEITMATTLLIAGGLLIRSFQKLSTIDPGFDASNVLTFQLVTPESATPEQQRTDAERLVERLESVPGIEAAGYGRQLPLVQLQDSITLISVRGSSQAPLGEAPDIRFVSRDYVKAMGMRVLRGRGFTHDDEAGRAAVMLINQALARRDFSGSNPLGSLVRLGSPPKATTFEIVGVVDDVRQRSLDRPPVPQAFIEYRQITPDGWTPPPLFPVGAYYAVRSSTGTARTLDTVRAVLAELNPHASLDNVATMDEILANSIVRPRLSAMLFALFALIAAALAGIGLYGAVSYAVTQRTREFGIRVALGQPRRSIVASTVARSGVTIACGLTLGLVLAWAVGRYLQSLLFGIEATDLLTFIVVAVGFALAGLIAAFLPALRGASTDPWSALRLD